MTKQELRQALEANGTLRVNKSQDPNWRKAFDLYNQTNKQRLNISCGGCWTKVREWLTK